jgi:hypothetical protein
MKKVSYIWFLLTILLSISSGQETKLATIIDGGVSDITTYSKDVARVMLWFDSEDCFSSQDILDIYSGDYPVQVKNNVYVYFVYTNRCTDQTINFGELELELPIENKYTVIVNNYAIEIDLSKYVYPINGAFKTLTLESIDNNYAAFRSLGSKNSSLSYSFLFLL